jgi:hypothetical protein
MIECFYTLKNFPSLPNFLIEESQNSKYVGPNKDHKRTMARSELWQTTKLAQYLNTHVGHTEANFIKMDPLTGIVWHTDGHRQVGINIPIMHDNSISMFREQLDVFTYRIYQVEYELHKPTVFNTKVEHSVINYNNAPRYTLTLEFQPHVMYTRVKKALLAYNAPEM